MVIRQHLGNLGWIYFQHTHVADTFIVKEIKNNEKIPACKCDSYMYMYHVYVVNKSTLRNTEIDSVNTKGFEA